MHTTSAAVGNGRVAPLEDAALLALLETHRDNLRRNAAKWVVSKNKGFKTLRKWV